ncbi:MAG: hypothetical protein COB12_03885 [Flavobacterium sp.]|nr:MAG: hypothetical protein COB12_03885 [Flavobacterium sp.]
MKKITLLLFLVAIIINTNSQNLVPNPSFEEFYDCPDQQGEFYVDFWFEPPYKSDYSPDFFIDCSPANTQVDVPENHAGFQYPFNGEGYVGVFCYGNDSGQREYIEVQLISPLLEGQEYEFSMQVSLPEDFGKAINNFGALFTTDILEGVNGVTLIEANPQVKSVVPIADQDNWTAITGTFIAEGGEEYLTIGNFYSDDNVQVIDVPGSGNWMWGYYYIDAVSLTPVILSTNDEILDNQLKVYPNPTSNLITIELTNNYSSTITYKLYNLLGELIYTSESNSQLFRIDMSDLSRGVYLLELIDAQSNKVVKKISRL